MNGESLALGEVSLRIVVLEIKDESGKSLRQEVVQDGLDGLGLAATRLA